MADYEGGEDMQNDYGGGEYVDTLIGQSLYAQLQAYGSSIAQANLLRLTESMKTT